MIVSKLREGLSLCYLEHPSMLPELVAITTTTILAVLLLMLLYAFSRRKATQRLLEKAGLPTVFWTPRFWNYQDDDQHLQSTSITRMLPRMERLGGPLGMYGTVYGFNTAVVHVAHPVAAKAILGCSVEKQPAYNHFGNFCGRGVFTADGDDWRAKRVAVLHALLRGKDSLEERVLQQAHLAANELVASIDDRRQGSFNVVPLIQQATIGLIFRYITHQDIPTSVKKVSTASSLLQQYLESVTNIRMIILAQSRSIWFLLPRWCYFTFSNLYQQEEQTMIPIRQFAQLACQMTKENSPLKQLQHCSSHQGGCSNGTAYTQDLLQEAITLLFAGQDTSAATLSWTLHLLSLHPVIQTKLANEVRSVVSDTVITKAMISRMPYLDAVIKESMRLYPVAPFVVRKLTQDIVIPGKEDSTVLPANVMACLWIYGLHHHSGFWSQPEEFLPERWLAASENKDAGISNGAYMPFCVGPRNCLGQPLAQWILRCLLARLVQRFHFQDARTIDSKQTNRSSTTRQDMQAGFTVLPRGGVQVVASLWRDDK